MRSVVVFAAMFVLTATVRAEDSPDWSEVSRGVHEALQHRDLDEWVAELEATPVESDAEALLIRALVLSRAGHERSLGIAVEALAGLPDGDYGKYMWPRGIVFDTLARAGQLGPAVRLLKAAEWIDSRGIVDVLRQWADEEGDAAVDDWLRERALRHHRFWFRERVSFHRMRGSTEILLTELAAAVRDHPGDMAPALDFAETLPQQPKRDLGWLVETARPACAWDCYALGSMLTYADPETALALLDRSMALPYDKATRRGFHAATAGGQAPPGGKDRFRSWTRHRLLEVLKRLGRDERMLALLAEMPQTVEGPHPRLAATAAEAEGEGPVSDVGRAILEREPADSDGWLLRAAYLEKRGDIGEAKDALFQALAVAPEKRTRGKGGGTRARPYVLGEIVEFLKRSEGAAAAAAFIYPQLELEKPGSDSAENLVDELRMLRDPELAIPDPFDERLWSYLEAREVWGSTEQVLLGSLARRAGAERRGEVLERARALTTGTHASRSLQLARSIDPRDEEESALVVQLFEEAVRRLEEPGERGAATWSLFQHFRRARQWEDALRVLPADRLGVKDLTELAAEAARSGNSAAALRLWLRRANLSRVSPTGVRDLVRLMGPPLRAYYAALSKRDPEFVIPPALAAALRGR